MALKIPPLLLVLLFVLAGWLLTYAGCSWQWPLALRWGWLIGWGMLGGGFAVAGVKAFRRGNTTVDPTRQGVDTDRWRDLPNHAQPYVCWVCLCFDRLGRLLGRSSGLVVGACVCVVSHRVAD